MVPYSVQPRDRIIVKSYNFFSFTKNISKNIHRNTSKILRSKYSKKPFDHAKQSAADALKTASKRAIQKTAEATGYLIGNKIGNRITNISKHS